MIKVGLAGGIGSGKSTVAKVFSLLGVPVFNSDEVAKNLTNQDATVKNEIISLLGEDAYVAGVLNRQLVAERVFTNKELLESLNAIIHPRVGKRFKEWCAGHYNADYLIKEAAILFESGAYTELDYNITVYASEHERKKRVVSRDDVSSEKVKERMSNQLPESERQSKADFVLNNEGNELLIPQVLKLHKRFSS